MSNDEQILLGIICAPKAGESSIFQEEQWVNSKEEWHERVNALIDTAAKERELRGYNRCPPDLYTAQIYHKNGYIYLYYSDGNCNFHSICFTRESIAEDDRCFRVTDGREYHYLFNDV